MKLQILITAGPTREFIDPVRFISNSSTGFFGYQIASEAMRRGHKVTLISGPTHLAPPRGARFIPVTSALEMKREVERFFPKCDCLIMSAAVSDYRPVKIHSRKIKKAKSRITLKLERNPDILSMAAKDKGSRLIIGFALETDGLKENARRKLETKNLDCIIAASVNKKALPFGDRKIRVLIIPRTGRAEAVFSSKKNLSRIILDKASATKYPYSGSKIRRERRRETWLREAR